MNAQVVKWGNGQGIRLPKPVIQLLDISVGDTLKVSIADNRLIIEKAFQHQSLEDRAKICGGCLLSPGEADWGEPEGDEIW